MSDLNFDSLYGDAEIDIDCPSCEKSLTISLSQIGSSVTCPNCSVKIDLQKDENFDSSVEDTNKALSDLEKTLDSFGK